jgi:uncharacterized membrane protein YkoI
MKQWTRTTSLRLLIVVSLLLVVGMSSAIAAPCLSQQQTREAIDKGQIMHLADIKAAVRKVVRGEVVRSEVCQSGKTNKLVYQLTILSRTGTVTRVIVDAQSSAVLSKGGF